jgi:hypothetical protein
VLFAPFPVIGDFAPFKDLSKIRLWEIAERLCGIRDLPRDALLPGDTERICRIEQDGALNAIGYRSVDVLLDCYFEKGFAHPSLFAVGLDDALVRLIMERVAVNGVVLCRLPPGINVSGPMAPVIPRHHAFGRSHRDL